MQAMEPDRNSGEVSFFEKQFREWIIKRHNRAFCLSLIITLIMLFFIMSFRFTLGGLIATIGVYLTSQMINSALLEWSIASS
ncbi:MAG: hypothetical protein QXV01_07045 [Candidatus Bathyarchaeia archaeon]